MHAPWVVVDTGTLLTLMLGGEPHQPGFAYAKLLVDLAEKRLIRLVIPDMVAAEFCGVMAPLSEQDLLKSHPLLTTDKIPYGFSKPAERIALLKQLLRAGSHIVPTPCGEEFLTHIQELLPYNPEYQRRQDRTWPPTTEEVRYRLMSPRSSLFKAVKQNSLLGSHGDAVSSGKQDRGELAVADCVAQIHVHEGSDAPVFVLFEGGDVRGRIIQRIRAEYGSEAYHQWHGQVLPAFNPNDERFEAAEAAALGNINFLSTKGFLAGLMKAANELSPARRINGHEAWYILAPNEAKNKDCLHAAYKELIAQVNENGLSRVYDKYRDRSIQALMRDDEHEYAMVDRVPQRAPWMEQMHAFLADSIAREGLRSTLKDFVAYRNQALFANGERLWQDFLTNMQRMRPESAQALLRHIEPSITAQKQRFAS